MSSERVTAVVAGYGAAAANVAALDYDSFTHLELLDLLNELETVTWQMPTVGHRVIARLQREASPVALGATSLKALLTERLRISQREAQRRLSEAGELEARTALTGEPMAPLLPQTATAQRSGTVGPEHVDAPNPGAPSPATAARSTTSITGPPTTARPTSTKKSLVPDDP